MWSNAAAPRSPTSSFGVNTSSMPACGRFSRRIVAAATSIAATVALLSAPRIVPAAFRTTPSATTGSIGPSGGTVSRCAQRNSGTPLVVVGGAGEQVARVAADGRPRRPPRLEREVAEEARDAVGRGSSPGGVERRQLEEQVEHLGSGAAEVVRSSTESVYAGFETQVRKQSNVAQPLVQASLIGEAIDAGPVLVFVFDEDGRYVAANQEACDALGYARKSSSRSRWTTSRCPGAAKAEHEPRARTNVGARADAKDGSTFAFEYSLARRSSPGCGLRLGRLADRRVSAPAPRRRSARARG